MPIPETVNEYLKRNKVKHELVRHPRAPSASRVAQVAHVSGEQLAKGVVLKDADGHVLAVLPATRNLDLQALNSKLDRSLELVEESELAKLFTDCDPGAVPAVGPAYDLETVVDESLLEHDPIYFEAGDHQDLVKVKRKGFEKLLGKATRGSFSQHRG